MVAESRPPIPYAGCAPTAVDGVAPYLPPHLAPPESWVSWNPFPPPPHLPTWLAGGAGDAVIGAAVLVVGAGVAVVGVSFGGVAAGGAVHAMVLVLVGVERFAVGSRGRRTVAVRGSPRGAVVVGIGSRRLRQSWRFLRRMVHGCGRLERGLEVAGSDAGDPSVKHSCHRSLAASAVLAAVRRLLPELAVGLLWSKQTWLWERGRRKRRRRRRGVVVVDG